jgi:hypothetical protein
MEFFAKLLELFSPRAKFMSIYNRGMHKARQQDMAGAIDDYTLVIDQQRAPAELRAMALLNRGLAYSFNRDYRRATADLDVVLHMPGAPKSVCSAAKEKLAKLHKATPSAGTRETVTRRPR